MAQPKKQPPQPAQPAKLNNLIQFWESDDVQRTIAEVAAQYQIRANQAARAIFRAGLRSLAEIQKEFRKAVKA